jgi:hypothetical protein
MPQVAVALLKIGFFVAMRLLLGTLAAAGRLVLALLLRLALLL